VISNSALYRVSDFIPQFQDQIPDLTPSQRCHISMGLTCNHYKPMGLQNLGTGRHINTLNLVEDMLLFTSNKVTLLQCLYNRCSKWPPSPWICSLYHSSVPAEMSGAPSWWQYIWWSAWGQKHLRRVLALHLLQSKCHLSAIVCISHAARWRLLVHINFKVKVLYICNSCKLDP